MAIVIGPGIDIGPRITFEREGCNICQSGVRSRCGQLLGCASGQAPAPGRCAGLSSRVFRKSNRSQR